MKKLFKYILLIVLFLTIGAFITETVLGIIYNYRNRDIEPMAARDFPYLYFLYQESPGRDVHGFKTDYPQTKQPGKFRIILTGGSVAMGRAPGHSISHYLEQELNSRFNTDRIEVVNAGVSAFVAEQVFLNIQLIVQHYNPDIIVSLDGYNDLMTFKLNRQHPCAFELPPHYWQNFKVTEYNIEDKTFKSRFSHFFRNTSLAIRYLQRKEFEKNYDWTSLTDEKLQPYSSKYWQIIEDTYDFCKAKHISYYSFLQPAKSYDKTGSQDDAELRAMSKLYGQFESGTKEKRYAYSLTSVFNSRPDIYTDDCHVTPEGNQIFSKAIAERLADEIGSCLEN